MCQWGANKDTSPIAMSTVSVCLSVCNICACAKWCKTSLIERTCIKVQKECGFKILMGTIFDARPF